MLDSIEGMQAFPQYFTLQRLSFNIGLIFNKTGCQNYPNCSLSKGFKNHVKKKNYQFYELGGLVGKSLELDFFVTLDISHGKSSGNQEDFRDMLFGIC